MKITENPQCKSKLQLDQIILVRMALIKETRNNQHSRDVENREACAVGENANGWSRCGNSVESPGKLHIDLPHDSTARY